MNFQFISLAQNVARLIYPFIGSMRYTVRSYILYDQL